MKRPAIPARHPHGRAFTLVELMVIVAVIGIVSGVAYTTMAAFLQEQKLRQASLELASYLQSARARAQPERRLSQGDGLSDHDSDSPDILRVE